MTVPGAATACLLGAAAAAQAFPTIAATNTSSNAPTASDWTVSLPASIAADDLLIILVAGGNAGAVTTPTGWTSLFEFLGTDTQRCYAAYKVASGTEGASVAVAHAGTGGGGHNSYRITGYQGTPESATDATAVDPPNLAPTWGSAKTMWLAVAFDRLTVGAMTAPTNYTNILSAEDGSNQNEAASARRELEAASENPGVFGNGGTSGLGAATIAVRPA